MKKGSAIIPVLFAVLSMWILRGEGVLPFSLSLEEREFVNIREILKFKARAFFSDKEIESMASLILEECKKYNLDPHYILSIIEVESSFVPLVKSDKGAIGLMQVVPSTSLYVARILNMDVSEEEIEKMLYNPFFNLKIGINYYALLRKNFGNRKLATLAYFWGPLNVMRFLEASLFPDDEYFQKVIFTYSHIFSNIYYLAEGGYSQ